MIKNKSKKELQALAKDIREQIIEATIQCGGHLASNLGMVDLTIAMHSVFDFSSDKVVWDVGHQVYAHKILTDRPLFKLRQVGGVSGFPNPSESDTDIFYVGHSSTALSSAMGLARARDINKQSHDIVVVIGDGALTGGQAYEALNDVGFSKKKLIIVFNDNKMSISKNVGAISRHVAKLRLNKGYNSFKHGVKRAVAVVPLIGNPIVNFVHNIKRALKLALFNGSVIERLGIDYYGPFDGHNIPSAISILRDSKKSKKTMFLHFVTEKGKGYIQAENNPKKYHGISPELKNLGVDDFKSQQACVESYGKTAIACLIERAKTDEKIICITAAMGAGTGVDEFLTHYPNRCIDVGIAEAHALTMAAATTKGGIKPYFAVYSTFLQRAYDQLIHDTAINGCGVRLLIDRAGVVSGDGLTHQGIFDIAFMLSIPNVVIIHPMDTKQLKDVVEWSLDNMLDTPIAIRYPKDSTYISSELVCKKKQPLQLGKWEWLVKSSNDNDDSNTIVEPISPTSKQQINKNKQLKRIVILCVGDRCIDIALRIKREYEDSCIIDIVNCVFIKPMDLDMLADIKDNYWFVLTIEDGIRQGGFGQQVVQYYLDNNSFTNNAMHIHNIGYVDFVASVDIIEPLEYLKNSVDKCVQNILHFYE